MKLLARYNRINSIASITVFMVGCVAFYFMLHNVLLMQLDKTLMTEYTEIVQYVKEHDALPEIVNTYDQHLAFEPALTPINKPLLTSTKTWIEHNNDIEWARNLIFTITVAGRQYKATVTKSQVETEDLVALIAWLAIGMIALIVTAGFIINRIALKKLWQPFYHTLQSINQYGLTRTQPLQLPATGIEEFSLLNNSLNTMAKKIEQEYHTLKEFTINAAHEMQTPLAVIATQTDMLMQDENVLKMHHSAMAIIEQSVSRLSRLNQSLLLLAKLDNQVFEFKEEVKWDVLINQKTNELTELMASQNIKTGVETSPVSTVFHPHLADILISNLVSNAIRYNIAGGLINICLDTSKLSISNSSALPQLDAAKLFTRFYRHPQTKQDGNGLGLSIVKQVCDMAGYRLSYAYNNAQHTFIISF